MLSSLITLIRDTLIPFGGAGVFAASVIEEVIAPIPSPFVQMAAGFFLLPETFTATFVADLFLRVVFPASLGVAVGSLLVFYIGYYSGRPALIKWGKWFGLKWSDVERAQRRFESTRADSAVLFFLRAAPIVPSVAIAAMCGVVRMSVWRYLVYSFFGTLVRASFLGIIGWKVGELYLEYSEIVDQFETVIFISIFASILLYVVYRLIRRHAS